LLYSLRQTQPSNQVVPATPNDLEQDLLVLSQTLPMLKYLSWFPEVNLILSISSLDDLVQTMSPSISTISIPITEAQTKPRSRFALITFHRQLGERSLIVFDSVGVLSVASISLIKRWASDHNIQFTQFSNPHIVTVNANPFGVEQLCLDEMELWKSRLFGVEIGSNCSLLSIIPFECGACKRWGYHWRDICKMMVRCQKCDRWHEGRSRMCADTEEFA